MMLVSCLYVLVQGNIAHTPECMTVSSTYSHSDTRWQHHTAPSAQN